MGVGSETGPSIRTAQVPQVPFPRQWIARATRVYRGRRARSRTTRRFAPWGQSTLRPANSILYNLAPRA